VSSSTVAANVRLVGPRKDSFKIFKVEFSQENNTPRPWQWLDKYVSVYLPGRDDSHQLWGGSLALKIALPCGFRTSPCSSPNTFFPLFNSCSALGAIRLHISISQIQIIRLTNFFSTDLLLHLPRVSRLSEIFPGYSTFLLWSNWNQISLLYSIFWKQNPLLKILHGSSIFTCLGPLLSGSLRGVPKWRDWRTMRWDYSSSYQWANLLHFCILFLCRSWSPNFASAPMKFFPPAKKIPQVVWLWFGINDGRSTQTTTTASTTSRPREVFHSLRAPSHPWLVAFCIKQQLLRFIGSFHFPS